MAFPLGESWLNANDQCLMTILPQLHIDEKYGSEFQRRNIGSDGIGAGVVGNVEIINFQYILTIK